MMAAEHLSNRFWKEQHSTSLQVAHLGKVSAGGSWLSSWVETLSFGFLARATDLSALYPIKPPNDEGLILSVKEDVEKLKASGLINPTVDIYGFVYDTHKGELTQVASHLPQESSSKLWGSWLACYWKQIDLCSARPTIHDKQCHFGVVYITLPKFKLAN